ncbi:mitochondrial coenzyme A diphosphatase NUDT8 [Gouania willdenowi]|uniref:Nudix hydrolase domain-containing protein n=1 Tax=Gouania willdenowi TaxID=441366 RepID=A0A8C5DMA7_GOUWI|nr:nucleoside diphosphate-linked moiety X motif 8 [Gouania willdenowi]
MFRHLHTWTCSCSRRSLLLLRETRCRAVSENPGWVGRRRFRIENGSLQPSETGSSSLSFLDCDKYQLRRNFFGSFLSKDNSPGYPPQASVAKINKEFDLNKDYQHFPNSTTHALDRRGSLILSCTLPNQTIRTGCEFFKSHFHPMQHFLKPFSSLAQKPLDMLNHHFSTQAPSVSIHSMRGLHQAAPQMDHTSRDCLSSLNENRCRQQLEPNMKFYQLDKGRQGKNQVARWASVLVSLCSVEGEPAFLFTLRSSILKGRHKGDVSFAGGKSDPSDGDVVTTALREAREELGIRVGAEKVWGVLKPLRDASGMMVAPVLANLGPLDELTLKPNPGEVEEIFTLSVSHLCNPQNCGYTHFRTGNKYGYTLPVFRNGKHRVWGLTAVALDQTLKLIIPPKQLRH